MERLKERRDEFLEGKKELLLHFLPDNDYFKKKEKREKRVIEKDKKMKEEAVSLAFNTAQVGYTITIDNSGSSVDDAAKLIASLSGCESAPIIDTDAVKNGDPQTDIPHQSVEEVESGGATSSSRSVNWDCKSPVEVQAHSSVDDDVKEGMVDEEDADADASAEPVELQVSYAMRGVPLVAQPPTLIAELHDHQVSYR